MAVNKNLNRNGVPRACSIMGMDFDSHTDRNKYFGLENYSIDLIEKRLARGWTEEQATGVAKPPSRARDRKGNPKSVTYNMYKEIDGTIYPDAPLGEFKIYKIVNKKNKKEYIGLTIQPLNRRLSGHLSEAMNTKGISKFHRAIRKYGKKSFTINLIRNDARNYKELGDQEIEEIKIRDAIKFGYNTSIGGDIGTGKIIIVDNKQFNSWSTAASYYNIEPYNFNQRITKLGWSPEEAAGLIIRPKFQRSEVELENKVFLNLKFAAEHYNFDYKAIHARKLRGWTLNQMFNLDPPPDEKQMIKKVSFGDLDFTSQAEFARYLNVSPSLISKLKKKLTYNEIYKKYSALASIIKTDND